MDPYSYCSYQQRSVYVTTAGTKENKRKQRQKPEESESQQKTIFTSHLFSLVQERQMCWQSTIFGADCFPHFLTLL